MKIAILDFEGSIGSSVAGPYDFLVKTPLVFPMLTGKPFPVSLDTDIVQRAPLEGVTAARRVSLKTRKQYDLIIIPAMDFASVDAVLAREKETIAWITRQHKGGAELASICMGAFLLAAAGLLDNRRATTHWLGAQQFRRRYPHVQMEDDKIIVDDGGIYSCAGAYTFTSFMVYLLEKFCGHEVAYVASKVFMVNTHNQTQHAFSIFQLQQQHVDEGIMGIQQYIEGNHEKQLQTSDLAQRCSMSTRNFLRRFEAATGNTPLEYQQRVRIEAAKRMLENGRKNVAETALSVGYDDLGFFRKIFKRHVGLPPREYRDRYMRITPASVGNAVEPA